MYSTLPLEKRLSLLSRLLQQEELDQYSEHLGNDSDLENSVGFLGVLESLKSFIQESKWDQLSGGLL